MAFLKSDPPRAYVKINIGKFPIGARDKILKQILSRSHSAQTGFASNMWVPYAKSTIDMTGPMLRYAVFLKNSNLMYRAIKADTYYLECNM
ncbi:MAG TPA: hypothetical protein DEO88_12445 [Syntrophobacteraceae bacterium]|nr:hypothetical protein [Syntrophobacteraceae bacterium]